MKKVSLSIAVITVLMLGTGCSTKEPIIAQNQECVIDGVSAPTWTCGADYKDQLTAVGIAPKSALGIGFTRREAQADGRSNLAQQIQTLVKDKVERFARSTGINGNEVADKVSTQVSKQVAKQMLSGSKQVKLWSSATDVYVLMVITEDSMNTEVKNTIKSSFKNNNALWQQFQSKQALENLEKEFPTD